MIGDPNDAGATPRKIRNVIIITQGGRQRCRITIFVLVKALLIHSSKNFKSREEVCICSENCSWDGSVRFVWKTGLLVRANSRFPGGYIVHTSKDYLDLIALFIQSSHAPPMLFMVIIYLHLHEPRADWTINDIHVYLC